MCACVCARVCLVTTNQQLFIQRHDDKHIILFLNNAIKYVHTFMVFHFYLLKDLRH